MTIENMTFAVQRGDTAYSCVGSELKDKLASGDLIPVSRNGELHQFEHVFSPPPWEGAAAIYHVIVTNPADITITNQSNIYNLANQTEVSSIDAAGEWIITGVNTQFKNSTGKWDFGNLTDTSKVTDMHYMFQNARYFNSDISDWDVSNVTDMARMFFDARAFNSDIGSWNVGNVTTMVRMFQNAVVFNQDISNWDVGNVKTMARMFFNAPVFNADISNWNVSNVTNINNMFNDARAFNKDISNWNVSNVTAMVRMFFNAFAFNSDISNWDVGNVTDMSGMFNNAQVFNSDISNWDVDNVKDMYSMFSNAKVFNQNLTSWCVTNITSEPVGFKADSAMPADGSNDPKWGTCPPPAGPWDGAAGIYHVIVNDSADITVTNQSKIYNLANQTEVSSINAAGEWVITGVNTKFLYSTGNWDFGALTDTSNVTNMVGMFNNAPVFNSDISNWDVSNVTNMRYMFESALAFNSNISNWNVSNVTCMNYMFNNAQVFNQNLTSWCVTKITGQDGNVAFKDNSAMPSDGSYDPVWGTCPRGENQS